MILGFAKSIPMIALSRAVDGLLGSNGVIAQSYLSDISSRKDRSKVYGISGAAAGFGFLIGPAAGGALAKINFALPAFIAAGLSLTTIIMTKFLLKETIYNHRKKKLNLKSVSKEINPLEIFKNFKDKNLRLPLMILFSFILTLTVFVSNFTLFGERQFHLRVDMVGYLLAYVGLISIIVRGVVLSSLIDRFNEHRLARFSYASIIISLLMATFLHGLPSLLLAITLFSLGIGLLRPILLGEVSRSTEETKQGEILGLTGSLTSTAQIVGPILGGFVLTYISYSSLPILSTLIILSGFYLYHIFVKKKALSGQINRA